MRTGLAARLGLRVVDALLVGVRGVRATRGASRRALLFLFCLRGRQPRLLRLRCLCFYGGRLAPRHCGARPRVRRSAVLGFLPRLLLLFRTQVRRSFQASAPTRDAPPGCRGAQSAPTPTPLQQASRVDPFSASGAGLLHALQTLLELGPAHCLPGLAAALLASLLRHCCCYLPNPLEPTN